MTDRDLVEFLQWALPRLQMRWRGFRKVRRQVGRRIAQRLEELGLGDLASYRAFLEVHAQEWSRLGELCRVTISRFHRDRGVFERLREEILPELARRCRSEGRTSVRVWSAGCASGEEPYSVAIAWKLEIQSRFPELELRILATDLDPQVLQRAREGVYAASSLWELPAEHVRPAFLESDDRFRLREEYRAVVEFRLQDIRNTRPDGPFDLILCRNLVLTYFDEALDRRILKQLIDRLRPGGVLVVGVHEEPPEGMSGISAVPGAHGIWRRTPDGEVR